MLLLPHTQRVGLFNRLGYRRHVLSLDPWGPVCIAAAQMVEQELLTLDE